MAVDYKLIGERIKAARKSKKITQEQLAEYIDVSVGYISQLERGIAKINLDRLSEIADFLKCDIASFLNGSSYFSPDYLLNDISDIISQMSSQNRTTLYEVLKLITKNDRQ